MTRKRKMKLLMAIGLERNDATKCVAEEPEWGLPGDRGWKAYGRFVHKVDARGKKERTRNEQI